MKEFFIGFDSAWGGRELGAVSAVLFEDGIETKFLEPLSAGFDRACNFMLKHCTDDRVSVIAIDQPLIVNSETGYRPVEHVAQALLGPLGGRVLPGSGHDCPSFFGDGAPIWRFLNKLGAMQDPMQARTAKLGKFVMEVFPALSIPSMAPSFLNRDRGKVPKYNPGKENFQQRDWAQLIFELYKLSEETGCGGARRWFGSIDKGICPSKSDQDRLDAVICMLIAVAWRKLPMQRLLMIGDTLTGYIITVAIGKAREALIHSAQRQGVPLHQ
jgi:predicted RNase H-like nuclease